MVSPRSGMAPSTQAPTDTGTPRETSLAELGWDFDAQDDFAGPHPPLQLIVVPYRPVLDEVAGGAGNIQSIVVG